MSEYPIGFTGLTGPNMRPESVVEMHERYKREQNDTRLHAKPIGPPNLFEKIAMLEKLVGELSAHASQIADKLMGMTATDVAEVSNEIPVNGLIPLASYTLDRISAGIGDVNGSLLRISRALP